MSMNLPQNVKKIWSVVSTVLVLAVLLLAVFLVGARLVGLQVYYVISPSMEPVYRVGDLIYVKKTDPATIEVGDDITFLLNEDGVIATHRVVQVDGENQRFYTQGVANPSPDANPVHFKNVLGVPVLRLPWLGDLSSYIQHPPGRYVAIGVLVALTVLVFLPDILVKIRKKSERVS